MMQIFVFFVFRTLILYSEIKNGNRYILSCTQNYRHFTKICTNQYTIALNVLYLLVHATQRGGPHHLCLESGPGRGLVHLVSSP